MQTCQDAYHTTFISLQEMRDYHREQEAARSKWVRCPVSHMEIEGLDAGSPLRANLSAFAPEVTTEAVEDTVENLGLAAVVDGVRYPVRETAYKSLLDRAKIGGSVLPKLKRDQLARILGECLALSRGEALVLIRDEKVSAFHSGDDADYSVLPIVDLLDCLEEQLTTRFPGYQFESGYADHALSGALFTMPDQKEDLLGTYAKMLAANGKTTMAAKLEPGIRFVTSDTGVSSAKVSALLMGGSTPIHIGSCVSVDHRHQAKIKDFSEAAEQLFAQYGETLKRLEHLLEIELSFPVNAMTRVCKKLSLPKKAAVEAISMFEMANGIAPATAHDVFLAMQEIPFIMKSEGAPESKMMVLEENLARALTLRWDDYDLPKAVSY